LSDIILHHHDPSPFAEKIRLALGLKGLPWYSVQIPMVMPKPDLTALTGGYRKTPVLQIGADIYCDTQRIALELEARYPEPTLFPGGSRGLAMALAAWSDVRFFQPGAGLSMGTNPDLPEPVLADRRAFFNFLDFGTLDAQLPHLYGQFAANAALVAEALADGRPYLLGDAPGWVDILAYFPLWMCRGNIRDAQGLLAPYAGLDAWESRVSAWGHGARTEMASEAALAAARAGVSTVEEAVDPDNRLGLAAGQRVAVAADDYGADPVVGELLRLTDSELAVRREDARAGRVVVHFPRLGYRVEAA
jgi:glutathione S-transferase